MSQILLVEDSAMFGRLTKAKLESVFDLPVYWVKTYTEAVTILNKADNHFSMALLDFNLPDAPEGEIIDEVIGRGISAFVFTSNITDEVRELVWSKKVADYILKDDPNSLDYIITAMSRLLKNEKTLVLVVDESDQYRSALSELLYVQKYRVVTAKDGKTALQILNKHKGIKLVITEYHLPDMNGWMFCRKIREKFKHDDLAIIGITSKGGKEIGARFIKSGANDFLLKQSFIVEEFYCRVTQSVETIDLIQETKERAIKDHLTGLYNRRYFFQEGEDLFENAKLEQIDIACAMLDIDFFKKVNDTYGHDVGDLVIQQVATMISEHQGDNDIVARLGGEEFCILSAGKPPEETKERIEEIRRRIEETPVFFNEGEESLTISISIGLCLEIQENLDAFLKAADELLYSAKENGRNRVVTSG